MIFIFSRLFHCRIMFKKQRNGLDATIKIEQSVAFVGRVQGINIKAEQTMEQITEAVLLANFHLLTHTLCRNGDAEYRYGTRQTK